MNRYQLKVEIEFCAAATNDNIQDIVEKAKSGFYYSSLTFIDGVDHMYNKNIKHSIIRFWLNIDFSHINDVNTIVNTIKTKMMDISYIYDIDISIYDRGLVLCSSSAIIELINNSYNK